MIPPLVYLSDHQKVFAKEIASQIGTTASNDQQLTKKIHIALGDFPLGGGL